MFNDSRLPWLAMAVLAAVTACGGGAPGGGNAPAQQAAASPGTPGAEPTPGSPSAPDVATAAMLEPWNGDLNGMLERRYVRMLVTFNRTNYFLDKAQQKGLTYEAGKAFEDYLNKRLKTKIKVNVVFIPVRRDQIFKALAEGRGDIAAANLTITPERQTTVAFATPWVSDVSEEVVLNEAERPIATADDFAGREIHVRRSSAQYQGLTNLNAALKKDKKKPVRIVEADEHLEDDDLLEMVNAGVIPATVVDSHTAALWSQVFDRIRVQPDVVVQRGGEIAWAIRKNAPELLNLVNAFVAANEKGSATFNILYKRYLQDTKFITNAGAAKDRERFRQMIGVFQRYGNQYNLPWLLVAAQGYQESQLDQGRKSGAGAVGIMQIKPSTAEGPPVYIKGVDKSAERNIEAGVKYLRFIVDEYFKDEPMTKVDKGLFAMASYNAGPARVAGLRRKAQQQGLDPNVWFGNVEIVAAREIGRETVEYVSNIYKYYVSYQLILQQREARTRAKQQR